MLISDSMGISDLHTAPLEHIKSFCKNPSEVWIFCMDATPLNQDLDYMNLYHPLAETDSHSFRL